MDAQTEEKREIATDPPRVEWLEQSTGTRCIMLSEPDFSRLKAGEDCLMARLAKAIGQFEGKVAKDRRNPDQGYDYASVDGVTKVCRDLSSDNGVVVLTMPVSRVLEKVQFRTSTGRRLTMVFRVAIFNAADPEDRMEWDVEVANDSTQDKGHQICMSTARKAALIEIFQLPRGDASDHEAQKHPGLAGGQTTATSGGDAAAPADVEAEVIRTVKAGRPADAWELIRAAAEIDQSGEISEARRNRLFAIARTEGGGWKDIDVRAVVKAELGIELEEMPYGTVYPAVVAFFQNCPPAGARQADGGGTGQDRQGSHEWTWEEVWNLTRAALGKVDADAPCIGEDGARKLTSDLAAAGFEPSVIAAVVRTELRVTIPELPRLDASGKDFPAWIKRGLSHFEAPAVAEFMADEIDSELDACPWMDASPVSEKKDPPTPPPAEKKASPAAKKKSDDGPPLEVVLAPVALEPGGFPGDEPEPAWAAIAEAYGQLLEYHEDAATAHCTPDDRLSLFSPQRNGGRNSAAIRAELQDRVGCAPDRLPAVLFDAVLATFRAFPPELKSGERPPVPDGWQKFRLPQLSELVSDLVAAGHLKNEEIERSNAGTPGKKNLQAAVRLVLKRAEERRLLEEGDHTDDEIERVRYTFPDTLERAEGGS